MTNALAVRWEVKASGEVESLRTPADTVHEDTVALDAVSGVTNRIGVIF